jgi:cysteine-rich repeat protein
METDPTNSSQCTEICGDGIHVSKLIQCDDGNLINGDGCSSTCMIEAGYNCSGGSNTTKDICVPLFAYFTAALQNPSNIFTNVYQNEPIIILVTFQPALVLPPGKSISDYAQV